MEFKVVKDIIECKRLWEKFSPKSTVWDLWGINLAFNKAYACSPYFIVGLVDGVEVGVLPLELGEDTNDHDLFDFFGGDYPERRVFFVKDKSSINKFLAQVPDKMYLNWIDSSEKEFIPGIQPAGPSFFLNLEKYNYDLDLFFGSFNKKHRKNIKYDLKQLESLNYSLVWNVKDHLSVIGKFSIAKFGEESDFNDPSFVESMRLLLDSAKELGLLQLLSVKINDQTEASQPALFYNGVYYVLTGSSNPLIDNLGKLLIVEHVKNAISLKAKIVDFLSTDTGWKKLWNLDEYMLYKFEK